LAGPHDIIGADEQIGNGARERGRDGSSRRKAWSTRIIEELKWRRRRREEK
jgi:hypothetical protein